MTRLHLILMVILPLATVGGATLADPSDLCLTAARSAAAAKNIPVPVLLAITNLETGRQSDDQLRPWPWAVNIDGKGYWFNNETEAVTFSHQALADGKTSFDTGCFQINYRWHAEHFGSLDQMFDPDLNANYAADFLSRLYAETGDWTLAAGAYHSRNETYASGYRERFTEIRQSIEAAAAAPVSLASAESTATPRPNNFPLLQPKSGNTTLGSLVILEEGI